MSTRPLEITAFRRQSFSTARRPSIAWPLGHVAPPKQPSPWRTRRRRRSTRRGAATARPAARRRSRHRAPAARGCWAQRPRLGGGAGAGHQQPAAAQLLRAARAAGQHRGGRRTAPGSAANATHLDRRGLSPSLAPAPRRGRAATASIAGRRPAHSSNVHCDQGPAGFTALQGLRVLFFFRCFYWGEECSPNLLPPNKDPPCEHTIASEHQYRM